MDKKLLAIGETARLIGVSVDTVRRWERAGILRSFRPSSKSNRYFRKKDIDAFLESDVSPGATLLFKRAREWMESTSPITLPPSLYCETSDVFNARLNAFSQELEHTPFLQDIFPLVAAISGEIGNNSYNHNLGNWPDVPGIFFGYNITEGLVVLADRGQGIFKTLKGVLPDLKDDREALSAAFTKYISGRAPENRGNGLKFVRDVVLANPLSIQFSTGRAVMNLSQISGQIMIEEAAVPINGCLARIAFSQERKLP